MKNNFAYYDIQDAINYGLIKAVILGIINKWCLYNQKHKNHFYDGYYWSGHMTPKQFSEQTGLNENTVRTYLKELINDNIIIAGNYNKKSFDRTRWYRKSDINNTQPLDIISPSIRHIVPNGEVYSTQSLDNIYPIHQTYNTPTIPDNPYQSSEKPSDNHSDNRSNNRYKLKNNEHQYLLDLFLQKSLTKIQKQELIKIKNIIIKQVPELEIPLNELI
jgi:hypothetical protein